MTKDEKAASPTKEKDAKGSEKTKEEDVDAHSESFDSFDDRIIETRKESRSFMEYIYAMLVRI
jgi:hypothetical protein